MNFYLFSHLFVYTFLIAILVLSLFYSRWHWGSKLALVVLVPLVCTLSYQSWRQAQGWPSATQVPERFMLNGAIVEEPNMADGNSGGIFLWLTDLKNHQLADEPRAYRLQYSEKLHISVQDALRKSRDGKLQVGELKRHSSKDKSKNPNRANGGTEEPVLEFRNLPNPALPEK